jgi:hypothetical protein
VNKVVLEFYIQVIPGMIHHTIAYLIGMKVFVLLFHLHPLIVPSIGTRLRISIESLNKREETE